MATTSSIHPTADIEPGVRIGSRTRVWHRAHIREGADIGEDCVIGKDVFIDAGVRIGDRVKIQNGALVYHGVTVGSGVFIGPGAILTNDRRPRAIRPDGGPAGDDDWTIGEVRLADGCSIGAGAIVVAGCDVGRFAMVGAGAVVTHPVADYALVAGNPARPMGWVCACGEPLVGDDATWGNGGEGVGYCPRDGRRYAVDPNGSMAEVST